LPHNWRRIAQILSFKDKFIVSVLLLVIATSLIGWLGYIYVSLTVPIPKSGGEYTEGLVGQPLYVNPLLSQTSEADSDLAQLIYSGLFRYDKDGQVVPELAESVEVSEDQRTYTVHLKKDLKWQDGAPLTASDVIFTINILQDQTYKSPLRQNWQGVDISQSDDSTIVFGLKNAYIGFMDNLTLGILPKHVWENISPEKFALAEYNLHPIGSGPYEVSTFQKDSGGNILTYKLVANKKYAGKIPYISKLTFNFYPDEEAMINAYNKKEVMGISNVEPDKIGNLKAAKSTQLHEIAIPRYFALFFNQTKSSVLADDNVRKALSLSIDRNEIVSEILGGKGTALASPFLPQMKEFDQELSTKSDLEQAKKILDDAGWKLEDGSSVRKKGGNELRFQIVTADWPELSKTAEVIKNQLSQIGVVVDIQALAISDLQQNYIRTREYDSLLFGQVISFNPDLYSFWHSSQKRDPGLNLAVFENSDVDKLLEDVRKEPNEQTRIEQYKQLQQILLSDKNNPAIFLYSPFYVYPTSSTVKGIDAEKINGPSQRFVDINEWYVKTSRKFK
jgi:peptide/nickel transport system substrate-binding protein